MGNNKQKINWGTVIKTLYDIVWYIITLCVNVLKIATV